MFSRLQQLFNSRLYFFKLDRSASFKAAVVVFLFSSISVTAIAKKWEREQIIIERKRVSNIANDYGIDIQRSMERTLSVTYAVSALVNEYQGIIPHFKTVARDLLPLYPGAYALALLPDGVVRQFVVSQNPQIEIPRNHLKKLNSTHSVSIPQKTGELSLITDLPLERDFSGAIAYLPIFLEDESGNQYFWGFTTVTINLFEVLQELGLERLEQRGFSYQLWRVNTETNQQEEIAKSSTAIAKNPVEQTIEIADTKWTLSLTPIAGWHQPANFWGKSLWGFSFSFMLAAVVKLFLDSKVYAFELDKIAYFDPLTSLPNRRFLMYRLEQIVARTKRNSKNVAVCCLDIDNFQAINQTLGHKAGDYILVRIAKRLQKFLRLDDVIARIGGDEFVIILQDLSHIEEAELVLKRIIEAVTSPIIFETKTISISTSIGVAIYDPNDNSIDTLLSHADRAMAYTKENDRGSYTIFSQLPQNIARSSS